jgi:hypothetical protein
MSTNATEDNILRSYLLGSLAPESRELVEKRLFSDDRIFWEHLCLVEDELVDDYVRNELNFEESAQFGQFFLSTDERRDKLEFALALRAYVSQHVPTAARDAALLPIPASSTRRALATAALLVLAVPAVVWFFVGARVQSSEFTVALSTGRVRGAGAAVERIVIPSDCKIVRLQLDSSGDAQDSHRASLHLATGEELLSQNGLKARPIAQRMVVTFPVPAELLPPEDYYVTLSATAVGKPPVGVGRYDFRVLPR